MTLVGRTALSVETRTKLAAAAFHSRPRDIQRAQHVVGHPLTGIVFHHRNVLVRCGVIDGVRLDTRDRCPTCADSRARCRATARAPVTPVAPTRDLSGFEARLPAPSESSKAQIRCARQAAAWPDAQQGSAGKVPSQCCLRRPSPVLPCQQGRAPAAPGWAVPDRGPASPRDPVPESPRSKLARREVRHARQRPDVYRQGPQPLDDLVAALTRCRGQGKQDVRNAEPLHRFGNIIRAEHRHTIDVTTYLVTSSSTNPSSSNSPALATAAAVWAPAEPAP